MLLQGRLDRGNPYILLGMFICIVQPPLINPRATLS